MAINEEIVTGRKFRKLVDETAKLWQRISFWTRACDVEFNDGKTAEEKLGVITSDIGNLKNNVNTLNNTVSDKLGGYSIHVMTLAQYNALTQKDNNTLYFCT